ncbi:MAG TPA: hypothetical protein VMV69_22090, partial [Pirellulales bacterium]|nr:hypothetical protein [Pirellulales bacterium]
MLNQRLGVTGPLPICPKRENFLDDDDKNAKLSVIIEIDFCIPSAYHIEAHASRGKPRFFMRGNEKRPTPGPTIALRRIAQPT